MRLIGAGMKQAEAHFHCIRIQKVAAHKPLGQLSVVSTGKWKAVRSTLDSRVSSEPSLWLFAPLFRLLRLLRESSASSSSSV